MVKFLVQPYHMCAVPVGKVFNRLLVTLRVLVLLIHYGALGSKLVILERLKRYVEALLVTVGVVLGAGAG